MEKIRKRSCTPIRLQGLSLIPALTTALARPLVHALDIEFHQEKVICAWLAIQERGPRAACHPGIANVVHLHTQKGKLREKPIRQGN